jgi:hypothetical protein
MGVPPVHSPPQRLAHGRDAHATFAYRASVPPASIARFVERSGVTNWAADAAFGVVVGSCDASRRATLEGAAQGVGGSVVFFDPSGQPLRLASDPDVQRLLERLKVAFDPRGALEPIPVSTP